ncbi:DUF1244 domain-containing protein [Sphingomonas sp. KR3-1]|uniref:DUF1244 domain-containing protein n=1 Tax=Sphingomonas sp. KR3-1 TaxID=3156611 RepID=UPI0032B46FDC
MDDLDKLDDAAAAKAFRSLVRHLRKRTDAQNIDLMGLAGFCRNCLADWIVEADPTLDREEARRIIYDMPFSQWKEKHQAEATPEQITRMEQSLARNHTINDELDDELDDSFPASDPPSITQPGG